MTRKRAVKNPAFVLVQLLSRDTNIIGPDGTVFATVEKSEGLELAKLLNKAFYAGVDHANKKEDTDVPPGPPDPPRPIHPREFA